MYTMLKAKTGGLKKETLCFVNKLIATPSESHNEGDVALIVEKEMNTIGFDKVFRDHAGNVVGAIFGRETTLAVLLCSHMDTMAPGDKNAWTSDPFVPTERNGKIFGRGASDCKGGLAAQVYSAALLKRSLLPFQGTVVVAATVTEKNGISAGTRELVLKTLPGLGIKPTLAILGEPTNAGLFYGHDGWMEIDVKLSSANTFNVQDAAELVSDDIRSEYLECGSSDFDLRLPQFSDGPGSRTATVRLRRRINAAENANDILSKLKRRAQSAVQSVGTVSVVTELRSETQKLYTGHVTANNYVANAWAMDPFHPMLERVRQALDAGGISIKPDKWKPGDIGKGTSGGVFFKEFGIPTLGYGPGSEEAAHSVDEFVSIDKLMETVYGSALIAHSIAGIPICGWTMDEI